MYTIYTIPGKSTPVPSALVTVQNPPFSIYDTIVSSLLANVK
jgi:hypothetical protein